MTPGYTTPSVLPRKRFPTDRAAREHFQTAVRLAPDNSAYAADLANWTNILGK